MTLLLLILMGFHLHGEIVHEWAGIIFTLLIMLHLCLNRHRLWSLSPNVSGAYVTFEPGARSAWHTHPAGQRLIVTSGVGLTQQECQPVQVIRAGDVVSCPAGVKHWHGAAPGSAMTHLAITGIVDGKSVDWKELVTDEQYHAH